MTYSADDHGDEVTEQRHAYARSMSMIFLVLAVIWLAGAATMFTAAIKGSTLSHGSAAASDAVAPAAPDSPAATAPAPAAQ